ncbi:hypothetical protein UlMin_023197 [Ulmus minor]
MQQAIPYKSWLPLHGPTALTRALGAYSGGIKMAEVVSENAVIVFVRRGCCMGHVVRQLLLGHGVNPSVCEVEEAEENGVVKELEMIGAGSGAGGDGVQFPAVFIGGKLFGGLDRVMAAHITGELVPLLKQAGALWL